MEEVILVDEQDQAIGHMEKLEAHKKGVLHRAFSVFVFDPNGRMLLQQRALHKYHSAGLWTNACCSHPRPGENTLHAATRRLQEEMGIQAELSYHAHFIYEARFDNELTEHEYDHVYTAITEQQPILNREEAADYAWLTSEEVKEKIKNEPERFTAWFKIAIERFF